MMKRHELYLFLAPRSSEGVLDTVLIELVLQRIRAIIRE